MFNKHIYHYIPKCPRCGSSRTGYYIATALKGPGELKYIAKHLKKGEIIRVVSDVNIPTLNCFCDDCNIEWHMDIPTKIISDEKLLEIKKEKYINDEDVRIMKYALEKSQKEKHRKKNHFGIFKKLFL